MPSIERVIEDVDVLSLDPNHVLANIAPPAFYASRNQAEAHDKATYAPVPVAAVSTRIGTKPPWARRPSS